MINLQIARNEDRTLLWNINQKYLYEMTQYYDDPMDENGNFHYGHFEEYFSDPNRTAYLLYDDDNLVGFRFSILIPVAEESLITRWQSLQSFRLVAENIWHQKL